MRANRRKEEKERRERKKTEKEREIERGESTALNYYT